MHLDVTTLTLILGTFLPLAIGLFVKSNASQAVKTFVMLVVTAVATLISEVIDSRGILDAASFRQWVTMTVTTIATYYGVWKPIGAGNIAPDVGVGPVPTFGD